MRFFDPKRSVVDVKRVRVEIERRRASGRQRGEAQHGGERGGRDVAFHGTLLLNGAALIVLQIAEARAP